MLKLEKRASELTFHLTPWTYSTHYQFLYSLPRILQLNNQSYHPDNKTSPLPLKHLHLFLTNSNFSSTEQLWPRHVLQKKTSWHDSRLTCLGILEQLTAMNPPLTIRTLNRNTVNSHTTEGTSIHFRNTAFLSNNNCMPLFYWHSPSDPLLPLHFPFPIFDHNLI